MALFKCKMCGGSLNLIDGASTAECEFCGSIQTVPKVDDEKKLTLFARANRLRAASEFDKAEGIYETLVADFPEEAEAYWGLVLCKYGIEYVDDPATGKKIPTCHRSSFESILEDSDYEQALENADSTARKVYREEAKIIEEIRKGIVAVSNNEQPYDIFICYKETAENGDRTLDSVLAQDVYDALTRVGYRVFFSRISLEDKLGTEYEPYIFAALNSAKIMLVFGTDYEYFNAVWVKNEWSRFLKLMVKDREKHLVPCFKGIDAYDMPSEFARLQAQDMGKVGAIQDLLRGIEKLLPKQKETTVVQEKVVVGGGGGNKVATLLDRGNIALEDGDWAKADSFFEDVLNNDAKNSQAYLGKALAKQKCRTIDAFTRKRKENSQYVRGTKQTLAPNTAHIDEIVKKYSLPGYVEAATIRKLYVFELQYYSEVAERKKQYHEEEKYWAEDKLLSHAEKFATGAVAQNLQTEKKALFAALADRVKKAEDAEAAILKELQENYARHIKQADERAEELYTAGCARREKRYEELVVTAKNSADVFDLSVAAKTFEQLGDYQDSKNLAAHCRKRIDEEQEKSRAEAERQRLLREKKEKERRKRRKRIMIVAAVIVVLLFAAFLFNEHFLIPNNHYKAAEAMLSEGKYEEAIRAFSALGDFRNSKEMVLESYYAQALSRIEAGKYSLARAAFKNQLKGYKNSEGLLSAISGMELLPENQFDEAIALILRGNVPVEIQYATNSPQPLDNAHYTAEDQYSGLATPVNTGYRFVEWTLDQYQYIANEKVVLTFAAAWSDAFLIRYDLGGGTANNPAEYRNNGSAITLNKPVRPGYTFLGWTGTELDGFTENVVIPAGSYGDRDYTANWKANVYEVTLDANGGNVDKQTLTVTFDAAYTLPTPTRENYSFAGWYDGNTQYAGGTWATEKDVHLTARWAPIQYKIEYQLSGGTNSKENPSSYTADSSKITLANPTKNGYKFAGWYTDSGYKNKVTQISTDAAQNITLYAKWELATYTIIYHLGGGTNASQNVGSYNVTTAKITLKDATKAGCKFLGWYTDSGYKNKITEISAGSYGNLDLYAKWEAIRYTITYNLNGGKNASGNPSAFTIDDNITLKAPTKKGYKFLGWYSDSKFATKVTQISKGSQKDITLYAKWEIITYTITYDLNGGTLSGSKKTTFTVKDLPLSLPSPSKTDFMFLGWKKDNFNGANVTQITECENITLYAFYMDSYLQLRKYDPYSGDPYYIVQKYSGTAATVEIPSEYQGYPVKEIGSSAFANNATLKAVNIPDSITTISSSAFSGCTAITKITLPSGVTSIGDSAFKGCTALTGITLPDAVKSIGSAAFQGCTSLASVKLPAKITSIGESAFEKCTSLTSINIPGSLSKIDYCTFEDCTSLETVILNEGLTEINFGAFDGEKLTQLIIPKSVTKIDAEAFKWSSYTACPNIVFYCRAAAMPSGWEAGWNNGRPIIWGYDEKNYQTPTYTFVTNGGTAVAAQKKTQVTAAPVSTRAGYALIGWFDNAEFSGSAITFPYYSTTKTTLYAKWMSESEYYNGSSEERAYRISDNATVTVNFLHSEQTIYYCFVPKETRSYTIESSEDPYAYCYLLDSAKKQLDYDYESSYGHYTVTYDLVAGSTYYLKIKPYYTYTLYEDVHTFTIR